MENNRFQELVKMKTALNSVRPFAMNLTGSSAGKHWMCRKPTVSVLPTRISKIPLPAFISGFFTPARIQKNRNELKANRKSRGSAE